MNDESPVNTTEEADPSETDLVSLVKRMQQQLNYLEKKIDTIEELEQERLEFPITDEFENGRLAYCNRYQRIVTAGVF